MATPRQGPTIHAILVFLVVASSILAVPASSSSRASVSITAGPYLQNATTSAMTVTWETNVTGSSEVEFGPTASYGNRSTSPGEGRFHTVTVSGLKANTTYHYRVKTGNTVSNDHIFRTAPEARDAFRFIAYGDTRTNETAHRSVVSRMNTTSAQMVLHVGDLVEDGTSQAHWDSYFNALSGFNDHTPMYPSIGNHEQIQSPASKYFNYYPFLGGAHWYSFDFGSVHFIALDTTSDMSVNGAQYKWLSKDLANAERSPRWKVVFFHHPPYSSVGSNMDMRNNFVPLFEKYHVDIVFSGHMHNYEHARVNAIDYIVTGGGGAPLANTGYSNWTIFTERTYEFVKVDVTSEAATLEAIRPDGSTVEKFTVDRKDLKAPDAPPLKATKLGTGGAVNIDWSGPGALQEWDIVGYDLYMGRADFTDVGGLTPYKSFKAGTYKTDITGLQNNVAYRFAVVAIDGHGNRNNTVKTVQCIPGDTTPPAAPQNVQIKDATPFSINLTWTPNIEPDLAGYKIHINATSMDTNWTFKPKDNNTVQLVNNITSVRGLAPKTKYCFAVQAVDNASPPNPSPLSNSVCGLTNPAPSKPRPNNSAFFIICVSVVLLVIVMFVVIAFYLMRSSRSRASGQYPSVQYQQHQPAYHRPPMAGPQAKPQAPPQPTKYSLDIPESTGEGKILVPKDLPAEPAGAAQASHRQSKDDAVVIIDDVEEVRPEEKDK